MGLSTHILDTALGKPVAGISVTLRKRNGTTWDEVGHGTTDADGRCRTLLGASELAAAEYQLRFETEPHFTAQGLATLYPYVEITFLVRSQEQHYHVPLLISANGYTTYRGS